MVSAQVQGALNLLAADHAGSDGGGTALVPGSHAAFSVAAFARIHGHRLGALGDYVPVPRCVQINQRNGPVQQNFKPLYLGHIEVDSADFWTDRFLSASS